MNSTVYPWLDSNWQQFCRQKEQARLPHAVLLSSVAGLGKNKFAQNMIASIHCDAFSERKNCGECHSCHLLAANSHPDHLTVSPEEEGKQIKIDQIRQLKEKHVLTPTIGQWKTVIISPAEKMNINSFNSLLKMLEEPQQNTLIILVTDKLHSIPVTIRSRCQNIQFVTPNRNVAQLWIEKNGNPDPAVNIQSLLTLFKGAPLAVLKAIEEDVDGQIQQIEQDFLALLKGQVNPIELTDSWKQYDPLIIFNQLQYVIKNRIINLTVNSEHKSIKNGPSKVYWEISDCIIDTIKLILTSNNINNTLLLEDFMVSIMDKTALIRKS